MLPSSRWMSGLKQCRGCGEPGLVEVLSLGRLPLANALLASSQLTEAEETYPLDLAFCPSCALAQITETVSPKRLFREYLYFSSFSDTALLEAKKLAARMIDARRLDASSLVVEIGSNDGYLLQYYKRAGTSVLGIEPAVNIARAAERERGIQTVCEFFSQALAEQLVEEGRRADVIHANNVLAHIPDLNGVVCGVATLLKPGGVLVVEVPYVKEMLDHGYFDTIYHEHLFYFSLTALVRLFSRHGLAINDVEQLTIHGGTLRLYAGHDRAARSPRVNELLKAEAEWRVSDPEAYLSFGTKVSAFRSELVGLLKEIKSQSRRIVVYGASAKGATLLNYFQIGQETIDYVVDRSLVKQGLYTPGSHLKIHAPEKLLEDQPDYTLLLTWNFAEEILEQQAEYRRRGGKFIIPFPQVHIV
jgi:SAM-dependent methyltransferase